MPCIPVFESGVEVDLRDIKQVLCEQQHDILAGDFFSTVADFEYEAHLAALDLDSALDVELDPTEVAEFALFDALYLED